FIIVGGLVFALVVYLILGARFVTMLIPGLDSTIALLGFWAISSAPVVLRVRRIAGAELLGAFVMAAIIIFIFLSSDGSAPPAPPGTTLETLFFSFGPILFALAGWTAVEPIYDLGRGGAPRSPLLVLFSGTAIAAALYLAFVFGIFGHAPQITPDTVSGLSGWPAYRVGLLAALGLFAIWTSYVPIGLEIRNALETDLGWRRRASLLFVFAAPLALVALGFNNFFRAVGVAGGVFLGLQYVLILLVAWRALKAKPLLTALIGALAAVFLLGAVYEIYSFVLH
ncbi:MAG: hypothetical protein AAB967_03730, partial [Patescibacteria group bacterium]